MVNEVTEILLIYEVLCIIIIMSLFISLVCNKCNANTEASLNFKLIHFNMFYSGVGFFLDCSEIPVLSFEQERKALLCILMFLVYLFEVFLLNGPNVTELYSRGLKFVYRGIWKKGLAKGLTTVYLNFSKAFDT